MLPGLSGRIVSTLVVIRSAEDFGVANSSSPGVLEFEDVCDEGGLSKARFNWLSEAKVQRSKALVHRQYSTLV